MQAASPSDSEKWTHDLSAVLIARLCHDLASPLGAIGNGVELLEMVHGADGPELQLVAASVRLATARLRMFRFAFGPALADQMSGAAEVRALLHAQEETARFWAQYDIDADVPRAHVKALLLGLMCMETALPWGGNVRISSNLDGYQLVARADRMRIDLALWSALQTPCAAIAPTAATIQFTLFQSEVAQQGFLVQCRHGPGHLGLTLTFDRMYQE